MMFMGQIGKLLVKTFLCIMDSMSQPEATLDLTTRIDATKEDYEKCVDPQVNEEMSAKRMCDEMYNILPRLQIM